MIVSRSDEASHRFVMAFPLIAVAAKASAFQGGETMRDVCDSRSCEGEAASSFGVLDLPGPLSARNPLLGEKLRAGVARGGRGHSAVEDCRARIDPCVERP